MLTPRRWALPALIIIINTTIPQNPLGQSLQKREILHYQMHHHHEVVPVCTSVRLPPCLQKPSGSCSGQVPGRQSVCVRWSLCYTCRATHGQDTEDGILVESVAGRKDKTNYYLRIPQQGKAPWSRWSSLGGGITCGHRCKKQTFGRKEDIGNWYCKERQWVCMLCW